MKKIYCLLALFVFVYSAQSQVVISEIMYNPPESGTDSLEYIEIQNAGNAPVQMMGWTFSQGINFTFEDFTLGVGEFAVIAVNLTAFQGVFGSGITAFQMGMNSALNNGGEPISLADSQGNVVSSVTYSNAGGGWYQEADGNGASIELCDPTKNVNDVANWKPSTNDLGITINNKMVFASPGAPNTVECTFEPDVIVMVGDFFFTPQDITINVGETVRWVNTSGSHNVNGTQMAYPDNPESFGSGNEAAGNWTYEYTFQTAGFYNYHCDPHFSFMMGTVNVEGGVTEVPNYAIGEINTVNAEGVADSLGVEAYVEGIIYGVNQRDPGLQYTIIDEVGDGIGLFNAGGSFISLEEGDKVKVRGKVEQFRGLLQLNISELDLISSANPLLAPVLVDELGEDTESKLVQIVSLTVVDPAQWTNNVNGFNVTLTNGTDQFTMRIARNVNTGFTEAPTGTFDLTGIGGQFSTNANTPPYLDGYQILPRYAADFDLMVRTVDLKFESQVNVFPTVASESISIRSEVALNKLEIFDMQGKLVQFRDISGYQNHNIDLTNLSAGTYILQILGAEGQFMSKKIMVQK